MVDVGVVEALLSVPGAYHAMRELLVGKKSDPKAVLSELEAIRSSLIAFSSVGHHLDELRHLHQNLQKADSVLDPCSKYFTRATLSGYFDPVKYPLGKARNVWELSKPHSLNGLIESLGSMRFVEDTSLVATQTGTLRIPRWGVETKSLKDRIDAAFMSIDRRPPGTPQDVLEAAQALRDLSQHIKTRMVLTDQEIRDRAAKISEVLTTLERDLRNG